MKEQNGNDEEIVRKKEGCGPMHSEQQPYKSYLLRLWRIDGEAGELWRASLESPITGERRGFASLHELFVFLEESNIQQQTGTKPTGDL